jgi:DNA-binding NarL/FixJ family response regulator
MGVKRNPVDNQVEKREGIIAMNRVMLHSVPISQSCTRTRFSALNAVAEYASNFKPSLRENNGQSLVGDNRVENQGRIRVLTVDAHPLLREGVASLINQQQDMTVVAQAANGHEAIHQFRAHRPDITLLDLRLADISGVDTIIAIRKEFPGARIVMFTISDGDHDIQRALKAGARGYLLKTMTPSELIQAIHEVHAGKRHVPAEVAACLAEHMSDEALSRREREVLEQLASGNRNRDIAARLFIAEETVKVHVKHIIEKLRANDRTQAVAIAARRGFIQL